ncbi:SGNH/GDSL hydrolase family protein [Streptomyces polychromogenes]|nr:SGNH/GDSL hydrolase family protein [Streptomyces polychromogenes]
MNSTAHTSCTPRTTRTTRTALAVVAAAAVLGLSACQQGTGATGDGHGDGNGGGAGEHSAAKPGAGRGEAKPQRLLWMGDSIGEAQAPALAAAMKAGGAGFASMAAAGGGGVIGEMAAPTWESLPKKLAEFKPDVVAYQITTYDWGSPDEQRAGYERLVKTVTEAGADLVIVSAPPFELDDFYKPHEAAIKAAPASAREIAGKHPQSVRFLDASALWGTEHTAAKAQRSKDGIHSCQQGSAAFAAWFGKELNKEYGFAAAAPGQWATGGWTADKVYGPLGCA